MQGLVSNLRWLHWLCEQTCGHSATASASGSRPWQLPFWQKAALGGLVSAVQVTNVTLHELFVAWLPAIVRTGASNDSSGGTVTVSDESTDIVAGLSPLSGASSVAHAAIASTHDIAPYIASSDLTLILLL